MSRRKSILLWCAGLGLAGAITVIVSDPCFRVHQGMTYDEVEAVLGKQIHGLSPLSVEDGSWTGHWPGRIGRIQVTFDDRDRVRKSPSYVHRVLDWLK